MLQHPRHDEIAELLRERAEKAGNTFDGLTGYEKSKAQVRRLFEEATELFLEDTLLKDVRTHSYSLETIVDLWAAFVNGYVAGLQVGATRGMN